MDKQQNITIKIADVAPISMTIDRSTEEWVREAERSVNQVWRTWRTDFSDKTSKEVLAMVAYQFAKLYFQLKHSVEDERALIENFEKELDRLLLISAPEAEAETGK